MRTRIQLIALSGALSLLPACHKSSESDLPKGTLRISSSASAFDTATGRTPICAHFTLQPYTPAADGSPQLSGSPISFDSNADNDDDASASTDQILGCIDGAPVNGFNWGYIVTADTFSECGATPGTLGNALTNVSPTTTTIIVPVDCQAGLDTSVPIHVQVAVSEANSAGYVDISAGVNATDIQVGCKQADINFSTDQLLHFGESYVSTDGAIPTGLVAVDDNGAPTQFGGTVNPSGSTDTYYTGDLDPSTVNTIYQTFLNPCSDPAQEYSDSNHAQCVSNDTGLPNGTVASLADAFIEMQGQGFAAASVVSGGLVIYSSMGGTPVTMNAASFTPGYNALTTTNILSTDASINAVALTGVYVDQADPMTFLVAAVESDGTPVYAKLQYLAGAWTVGSFYAVTGAVISCNGLYASPPNCFAPGSSAACEATSNQRAINPTPIHPINLGSYYLFVASYLATGGPSITVQTTGEPAMTLPGGGFSPFANKLAWGTSYNVSVTAPAGMTCMTEYGSGTIFADTTVDVICAPTSWQEVAVGGYVVAGIASDGTLWTWGNNYYTALGQGAATPTIKQCRTRSAPTTTGSRSRWG